LRFSLNLPATEKGKLPSMSLPIHSAMTDEQLLEAILRQDAKAQRLLYERFARKMFGVCLRYTRNREEAEDYLQDGFLKVFQKLSSFKNEGSLEGWIRRVIVNTCLGNIRQQKLQWNDLGEANEPMEAAVAIDKLQTTDLLELIRQLPPGFRTVFNLYAIEGYSHKEIAELLNITEGTSKSQFARARASLADKLSDLEKERGLLATHKE
jgi:RNA polymerase sigma factor (sigma-70 family)